MPKLITLLTDYGLQDTYVAEVKAVLLASGKPVQWIDLSHLVPSYGIRQGAFQLFRAYHLFPKGTYHLAVVDPGVGSSRHGVYVRVGDHHFVGPDNGVLLWAVQDAEKRFGVAAQNYVIPLPAGTRPTFHGRDVFAPFIAARWKGQRSALKKLDQLAGEAMPVARLENGSWKGEILAQDHFGNLITSIPLSEAAHAEAQVGFWRLGAVSHYQEIPAGKCALIPGSHGFWEIAGYAGSAAEMLKLGPGQTVSLQTKQSPESSVIILKDS